MTWRILSDSETGRATYSKEIGYFLENGLPVAKIPEGMDGNWSGQKKPDDEQLS